MKTIFVNGCFWHSHSCRYGQVKPKTNFQFWADKRDRTVARDIAVNNMLVGTGWSVLTVWECELQDDNFGDRLIGFLENQ
jgi:DNA mismatch endonuclease (patch repair protein)